MLIHLGFALVSSQNTPCPGIICWLHKNVRNKDIVMHCTGFSIAGLGISTRRFPESLVTEVYPQEDATQLLM